MDDPKPLPGAEPEMQPEGATPPQVPPSPDPFAALMVTPEEAAAE